MAVPDYQSLMLPVLEQASLGETRVPDVADKVADELGLTAAERDQLLPSGRQKILHNRIHWAKLYMAKAGLIDQPRRGWFVASEHGRTLLARNPQRISTDVLLKYPAFYEWYRGNNADNAAAEAADQLALPNAAAQLGRSGDGGVDGVIIRRDQLTNVAMPA
jgi:restriction system protein